MPETTVPIRVDAEKLLETFLELVKIDSPSGQEEAVCEYMKSRFDRLGLTYEVDQGGNLLLRIPASQSQSGLKLLITGHMDVVPPCLGVKPVVDGYGMDRLVKSSGDTVLGADDKAALAALVEALDIAWEYNMPRPELVLLITTREEVFLQGAQVIDPDYYRDVDLAVAFDHSGPHGNIVYEQPTYIKFTMKVHGKSVHAGIMPEKGINAIQLLSHVIEELTLGRIDKDTTANIGFIRGGKATNIVPDLAVIDGELRGHDDVHMQNLLAEMEGKLKTIVDAVEGASWEFSSEVGFSHYHTDPDHPMLNRVKDVLNALGLPVNPVRSNGGSDVNVFAQHGIAGCVLSAGYVDPHALTERVTLRDMVTSTSVILEMFERFAQP